METLPVVKFNRTVAELSAVVEESKKITATDLKDPVQMERVKKKQLELRDYRNDIKDQGKKFRDIATAFNREEKIAENALLEIILPEEDRLKAIREEAKELEIREQRLAQLPERVERLSEINFIPENDDFLLLMGDLEFENYYNEKVADKNEADRLALEEKKRKEDEEAQVKIDAENAKLKEAQDKLDKDKADLEAEKLEIKHEQEVKDAKEQAKKDAKEKENARIAKEKEAEDKKKKEDALLAKRKEYKKFRAEHGWTEETKDDFITSEENGVISLFKKVGEFKK